MVLFVDAFDVLVSSPELESTDMLMTRFQSMRVPIVFSGEVNMAPDKFMAWPRDLQDHPLPYLNSGLWIGEWDAVRSMVHEVLADMRQNFGLKDPVSLGQADDQRFYQRYFLNHIGSVALDSHSFLFLSLHGHERSDLLIDPVSHLVLNRRTGTTPIFLHGNGDGCELWNEMATALYGPQDEESLLPCFWPWNSF